MKIVAVEPINMSIAQGRYYEELFASMGHHFICFSDRNENVAVLKQRMKHADAAIVSNIPLPADILSACPQLKFISVAFTGTDHIDLEYCNDQGIEVRNASGYATTAVAELTIGLIIDLYRHITFLDSDVRKGGDRKQFLGHQIRGKVVGIVGTGAIGKETALVLQALGCKILAWDKIESKELKEKGVKYLSLDELLSASDIISLHLPLTPETTGIISADKIDLCKPSAIIINTARGKIVNISALAQALRNGKIAGAALDVYETEPPLPNTHPLLTAPNCLLVPHIGYATKEAFDARIEIVMKNVVDWQGKIIKTRE